MADTVNTRWLHPVNWDGGFDNPSEGVKRWSVLLTCRSDGTGESAVTKVDISNLRGDGGFIPTRTAIDRVKYDAYGFTAIRLYWDRTPAEDIVVLAGNNSSDLCFKSGIVDPGESGDGTGDILLTSTGATNGDTYTIQIDFRVKE